jgi:hypothetical protein
MIKAQIDINDAIRRLHAFADFAEDQSKSELLHTAELIQSDIRDG